MCVLGGTNLNLTQSPKLVGNLISLVIKASSLPQDASRAPQTCFLESEAGAGRASHPRPTRLRSSSSSTPQASDVGAASAFSGSEITALAGTADAQGSACPVHRADPGRTPRQWACLQAVLSKPIDVASGALRALVPSSFTPRCREEFSESNVVGKK